MSIGPYGLPRDIWGICPVCHHDAVVLEDGSADPKTRWTMACTDCGYGFIITVNDEEEVSE